MCGIAGLFYTDADNHPGRVIDAMTHALSHRGPDDGKTFVRSRQGYVGALGFRRLAVLDPDPRAMQPMHSKDGRYSLVFNGEIYNFKQLRQQLAPRQWLTTGDTEVVLAAYEQWGDRCLDQLRGMFAIAVVDWHNHTLMLARDRMGQKPLYVSNSPTRLAFASELCALKAMPDFDRSIRQSALMHYLRYGYVSPGESIYSGCIQLMPGQMMTIDLANHFATSTRFYFQESIEKQTVTSASVREHVERAVAEQMVSDVPLGVFLSGGIDSSIVALCARKLGKIKTFSIGFGDQRYDESEYARDVAKHLDAEHFEFRATVDVVRDVPRLAVSFGEPFADSSMLPTRLLCEETRKHVTVALSGDGGDELFGGYDRYRAMGLANQFGQYIPGPVASLLAKLDGGHPKKLTTRIGRLMRSIKLSPADRYDQIMRIFSDVQLSQLFGKDVASHRLATDDDLRIAADCMRLDRRTYLPGDLLTKVDRCSMLHSLEVRSPFMDHELLHHVSGLDDHALFSHGAKGLLNQAFGNDLPQHVFDRPKQGFAVPIGDWLAGDLHAWAHDLLLASNGFCQTLLNGDSIKTLLHQHRQKHFDHTHRLWALICLEQWQRVV
jgi:asparagine synthase (glutamine-hydrolysing)